MGLRDPEAAAYFTHTGALWMLGKGKAENEAMQARLAKFGVESDVVDAQAIKDRWPVMNTDPFPEYDENGNEVEHGLGELSAVYEHGCGHLDSSTCLEDLFRACVRDGVDIRFKQKVSSFLTSPDGSRCKGVTMSDGTVHEAGMAVVNGAGP